MTESVIKLPSQFMDEMEERIAEKDRQLADKDNQLADKDAKIRYLEEMLSQLMEEKRNTI
ncbi:MAG: hypothetical protein J1E61_03105 [Lachnospiraceae bacterium]|nr:hypothetical protein [Lachnospiraceae bacterium]